MKAPDPPGEQAGRDDHGTVSSPSTARAVADDAVEEWNAVAQTLAPIIGRSSVIVLYRRCLVSVGMNRTWLPSVTSSDPPDNDWAVLHASVSRQTAGEAAEACESLFVAFSDLLGSLIGRSLTEQLMPPVSALPPTGGAEQDTHP